MTANDTVIQRWATREIINCTKMYSETHYELGFGAAKNWFSGLFTFNLIRLKQ